MDALKKAGGQAAVERGGIRITAPFGVLAIASLALTLVVGLPGALVGFSRHLTTEAVFFWRQDVAFLIGMPVLVAAAGLAQKRLARLAGLLDVPARVWVSGLALICLVAGAWGVGAVFENYTLSLDEFMANFDARIFASGHLLAPIAPQWQDFAGALQPIFTLPLQGHAYWASGYLPVNAAMRAATSLVGAQWLLNPSLSALGLVATYGVGRRLWPDEPRVGLAAVVLLGSSAQLIVTAMTAYAMPAHLAFNMVWLWLFLRGGRLGHAGALLVGFLATGLHQILFHPIFAAPFILQLWLDRKWVLAGVYTAGYSAICGFWADYWSLESHLTGVMLAAGPGLRWLPHQIMKLLREDVTLSSPIGVAVNLARFATWQNPLLAPLLVMGIVPAICAKGWVRALALGILLILAMTTILVPTQVHGWGYRYLHGFLGSAALIAGWMWRRLTRSLDAASSRAATGGLVAVTLVSLLLLTPVRALQAWAYCHPYAQANAAIQASPSDVVLLDDTGANAFNAGTLVRNDPFLQRGPKVIALAAIDGDDVETLCAAHTVALFDGRKLASLGGDTLHYANNHAIMRLRAQLTSLHCGLPIR